MVKLLVMGDARSIHVDRFVRFFEQYGFEVALFSLEEPPAPLSIQLYSAKRLTSRGLIDYYLAKSDFRKAVSDFKPDIISAHNVVSYGWLASFCPPPQVPTVITAWGSDLLLLKDKSIVHRKRISRALRSARFCTVDNDNLKIAACEFINEKKVVKIIFGIDRELIEANIKRDFNDKNRLRIIAPRGLQKIYDPETILSALDRINNRIDLSVDMYGDKSQLTDYKKSIEKSSLAESVNFKSFLTHSNFICELSKVDIYLSASLSDSTSVTLLESMAVGLFPVVSDIEGNREWITDEQNGLLFRPRSSSSLAEAIIKAAGMRGEFKTIAEANRKLLFEKATWHDQMDKLKNLFLGLLN